MHQARSAIEPKETVADHARLPRRKRKRRHRSGQAEEPIAGPALVTPILNGLA